MTGNAVVSVRLRFVVADRDRHGNVRYYFRRPGHHKVRLPGEPHSEGFLEAYRKAWGGSTSALPRKPVTASTGSLRWLCEAYYRDAAFKQLDPRTQYVRRQILDKFCTEFGDDAFGDVKARNLKVIRDRAIDRPESANGLIKALRQLYKFAVAEGHTESNPASEVKYLESRNKDGFHAWTVEEVRQYEARHPIGTMARLALGLFLYTGQRKSDVVRLGRPHVKAGTLSFTQHKNRHRSPVRMDLPILPVLQELIDACPSTGLTFLETQFRRPFTCNGFGGKMRDWCDQAGLPQCSSHGLRKAAATLAAENGATAHQLMAMFGWKSLKEPTRYTKAADQKRLQRESMELLVRDEKSHFDSGSNSLGETVENSEEYQWPEIVLVPRDGVP